MKSVITCLMVVFAAFSSAAYATSFADRILVSECRDVASATPQTMSRYLQQDLFRFEMQLKLSSHSPWKVKVARENVIASCDLGKAYLKERQARG